MSADFSRLLAAVAEGNLAHADRDGLTGVRRAVFLARGGHAPGDFCPSECGPQPDLHEYWCSWPDDECNCPAGVRHPEVDAERACPGWRACATCYAEMPEQFDRFPETYCQHRSPDGAA